MENEEIAFRIRSLERTLGAINARLEAIEAKLGNPEPVVAPEPVTFEASLIPPPVLKSHLKPQPQNQAEELWPSLALGRTQPQQPVPPAPSTLKGTDFIGPLPAPKAPESVNSPAKPKSAEDIEYKFGINGLLRGGAVVIVFAFLFLTALMISRGLITPGVQFVGEIALCLGFIGFGLLKRDEKEDFGQLMVGLGSFGLYASFAGAHVYKGLIDTTALVGSYVLFSLANLAFAHWRASKSFLVIGLIGGFIASLLPVSKDSFALSLGLHFAILIPCAVVVIRNKWQDMAGLVWMVSCLALIPGVTSDLDQLYRISAIYLQCLVCVYAYGRVHKPSDFDPDGWFASVVIVLSGVAAIAVDKGLQGSLHAFALAIGAGAVGWLLRSNLKIRNGIWLGALIVFALIPPLGFTQQVTAFYYGIEALALVLIAARTRLWAVWSVGFATVALSLIAYTFSATQEDLVLAKISQSAETLYILLIGTVIILNLRHLLREAKPAVLDPALMTAAAVLIPLFMRLGRIHLTVGDHALAIKDVRIFTFILAITLTSLIATRISTAALWTVAGFGAALCGPLAYTRFSSDTPAWLATAQVLLASASILMCVRYALKYESQVQTTDSVIVSDVALFAASGVFIALGVRLSTVLLTLAPLHLSEENSVMLGVSLGVLCATVAGSKMGRTGIWILAGIGTFVSSCIALAIPVTYAPQWLTGVLIALAATSIWIGVRQVLKLEKLEGTSERARITDLTLFFATATWAGLFVAAVNLILSMAKTELSLGDSSLLGFGIAAVVIVSAGIRTRRDGILMLSGLTSFGLAWFAAMRAPTMQPQWLTLFLLVCAAISFVTGAMYLVRRERRLVDHPIIIITGLVVSGLTIRMMHLAGARSSLDLSVNTIGYFGLGLACAVWTAVAWKYRKPGYFALAWIALIYSGAVGMGVRAEVPPIWLGQMLLVTPVISLGILYAITPRREQEEAAVTSFIVLYGWALMTFLLKNELERPWIGMNPVAAVTVSWVVTAVVLIVAGFRFGRRYLRYWSLGVFAVTVGKVFIVDLSYLDSMVRVMMLLLLGLMMVAGGYRYILWKRSLEA